MIVTSNELTNYYSAAELKIIAEIRQKAFELIEFVQPFKSVTKLTIDFKKKTFLFDIADLGADYKVST